MRQDLVFQQLSAELARLSRRPTGRPRVVDVGGGSGGWAVPLAMQGCEVVVIDPSPNALATLQRRAAEAGVAALLTPRQGDTEALVEVVEAGRADIVLGHDVLEIVDDPRAAVGQLVAAAAPGGLLSVLTANRWAALLHRTLAGRIGDALRLLHDETASLGESDPLLRRFGPRELEELLRGAGLEVELVQGYGVLAGLLPGGEHASGAMGVPPGPAAEHGSQLAELEAELAQNPPMRDVAARIHMLARKSR